MQVSTSVPCLFSDNAKPFGGFMTPFPSAGTTPSSFSPLVGDLRRAPDSTVCATLKMHWTGICSPPDLVVKEEHRFTSARSPKLPHLNSVPFRRNFPSSSCRLCPEASSLPAPGGPGFESQHTSRSRSAQLPLSPKRLPLCWSSTCQCTLAVRTIGFQPSGS